MTPRYYRLRRSARETPAERYAASGMFWRALVKMTIVPSFFLQFPENRVQYQTFVKILLGCEFPRMGTSISFYESWS